VNCEFAVVLHDGMELKLSRSYRGVLEVLAPGRHLSEFRQTM
jgi:hypothetical protein